MTWPRSMQDFVSSPTFFLGQSTDLSTDVPYIANWIYEHPGLDLNLKGIWIADPSLTYVLYLFPICSMTYRHR